MELTAAHRGARGEGVVAEVLFPNAACPSAASASRAQHELRARATVRTTAGSSTSPTTRPRAALAMLTVHDLDATTAEITGT
jgi:hypothetical protein